MATRRPKVPSAHLSAGAKKAAEPSTTPDPRQGAHAAAAGARLQAPDKHGSGRAPRKAVTDPHAMAGTASGGPRRNADDGVIRNAGSGSTPVPARSFNGRLLVLGLAMAAVTVALAPNIHTYMDQRAEISALKQDIAAQTTQQSAAQSELARWDDPAYVKQQARDRVSMLMPGETGYWVYGAGPSSGSTVSGAAASPGESAKDATAVTTTPWVDGLWQAVEKSAAVKPAATAKATPKPAAK
jgi:cell division protein FtsB